MNKLLEVPWAFGLITVSGIAGAAASFVFYLILLVATGAKSEKLWSRQFFYSGLLTGIVERLFFTCLIGLLGPSGIAQAVVGWIAIKGQVHYKMFSDTSKTDLASAYVGLLGSVLSMMFAIFGGYAWNSDLSYAAVLAWLTPG